MERLETLWDCQQYRQKCLGKTLALVPTMGALHAGHLALIKRAQQQADQVVVSIFVNPLQFGPTEDFQQYPRPLGADCQQCEALNVDAVFIPTVETIYPQGLTGAFQVMPPESLTERFCGLSRPRFFTGVSTVVFKLFQLVKPDRAVFGEKDAQQLAVIRQMVSDFHLPIEILAHPIVREVDGLALSSRNVYLKTPSERQAARMLSQTLANICQQVQEVGQSLEKSLVFEKALAQSYEILGVSPEQFRLEYLDAVSSETFDAVQQLNPDSRVLMAGHVGGTRLIDNVVLAQGLGLTIS